MLVVNSNRPAKGYVSDVLGITGDGTGALSKFEALTLSVPFVPDQVRFGNLAPTSASRIRADTKPTLSGIHAPGQ